MKYLNTNILRILTLTIMAMVCTTGKADITAGDPETDPLAAWYNGSDAYILRTIDDDHKVIDAMKALQEVNSKGDTSWNDYSSYLFYLAEDVDFTGWQENYGSWIPLGTSSNPFCSSFYCYAPSWDYYYGPTNSLGEYPKNTLESPAAEKDWAAGYKFTYNISDIDLASYEESIDNFISSNLSDYYYDKTEDEISVYATMDGYSSFSSYFVNKDNNTLVPTVSEGNCYTYDIGKIELGESSIDDFISESLSSYFVVKDEENSTITIYTTEDLSSTITCTDEYEPTITLGTLKYRLLPVVATSPGYFYENYIDESSYDQYYYSTNGHIGTCAIKNLDITVTDGDAAGFFGYVNSNANLYGFTFENCSVTNEQEGGYAGMLYGVCEDSNPAPTITDLFIGTSSKNCTVTAENGFAGGVCGANKYNEETVATSISSYTLSEESYNGMTFYELEKGAFTFANDYYNSINKIYVTVNGAEGQWDWISSTEDDTNFTSNTYVHKEAGSNRAFAADDEGNYGEGTESKPFLISTAQHLKNLVSFVDGSKTFEEGSYSSGLYFKQTADIEVSLTTGIGTEATPFSGFYDGNGKTITVSIDAIGSSSDVLFSYTAGAAISDLKVIDNGDSKIAGIIGTNKTSNSSISRCIISVPISEGNGGLVGSASNATKVTVLDCYNVAANQKSFCSTSGVCVPGNNGSFYSGTTATGEGTSPSPLMVSSLNDLKAMDRVGLADKGLSYKLAKDIIVHNEKLVWPNGDTNIPDDATNDDAFINKFYGNIDGEYSVTENTYVQNKKWDPSSNSYVTLWEMGKVTSTKSRIISGITDQALFGEITGNSTISNVGFVNCYNKKSGANGVVEIANSIANNKELTLDHCYSDNYVDLSDDKYNHTTCYVRNVDGGSVSYTTKSTEETDDWIREGYSTKEGDILKNSAFVVPQGATGYYTDAIAVNTEPIDENTVMSSTDPRALYKYNMAVDGVVGNLYIRDFMDYYDPSKTIDLEDIKKTSLELNGATSAKNIYYCRKRHNDWESICLPFEFSMSDVENSKKFTAYTYSQKDANNATFTKLADDATIAAGQPVLILNKDKENYDFVIKRSDPNGIALVSEQTGESQFKGVLKAKGIDATVTENMNGKYKISGTKTTNGGGTLLLCNEYSWIYPFRTYLDFGTSGGAKSIVFSIDDDITAINVVNGEITTIPAGPVYSLDGRKVSDNGINGLKAGMYIVGGKKYVVK